jgi:hypothetical protein
MMNWAGPAWIWAFPNYYGISTPAWQIRSRGFRRLRTDDFLSKKDPRGRQKILNPDFFKKRTLTISVWFELED